MSLVLVGAAAVTTVLLAVGLFAVRRGPTIYDRFVAVAQATSATLVLLVLLGFVSGRPTLYLDIAITYGLLAMVVPIALSAARDRPHAGDGDASDRIDADEPEDRR